LVELLVVIATIGILACLLFPTFSGARSRSLDVSCLSNLRQLQYCWHLYTMDNDDHVVPNNSVVAIPGSGSDVASGASWCAGSPRYDTNTTHIEKGLLFEYNRSVSIYRCPADRSTVEDGNGNKLSQLRNRSYNLSQSMNGYPDYDPIMRDYIPSFDKLTSIQEPDPANALVFIDEHADTMYDALFGMPTEHYDGSQTWWDLPGDRHAQGSNLSFADGHAERWKWAVPKTFRGWVQPILADELPDWQRLKKAMKQHMH
jgi:prepilin-type processing-associated H-X9-DG protein